MGAVYKTCEPRKQKGRFIYNRDRLHKAGWTPKHKEKHRQLEKEFKQLEKLGFNVLNMGNKIETIDRLEKYDWIDEEFKEMISKAKQKVINEHNVVGFVLFDINE